MSDVDERVVRMEFDNGEFERNAKQTMSTLDRLKETLNFKNTEKSFNQITEAANKVDVSNVTNSVEAIQSKFSTMQIVAYTAISNITNRMMNFAHNVVAGTFSKVVQGGLSRSFNIEKAKFTIEGLGKDFKKLEDDINYAVSGTAYGFDEAAMAASSMSASGIEAGDKMKQALRSISGMAAMTGSGYSEIADIFTTVAGNGRLLSQQLNQLSSRGVNAAATLRDFINANEDLKKKLIEKGLLSTKAKEVKEFANAAKLTEQNVRSLVSGSVIDFDIFSQAIDDAFGSHAKAANKTFNGVVTNIKAALSRIGEVFVHPLIANNDMDAMLEYVNTPLRRSMNDAKKFWAETSKDRHKFFKDLRKSEQFAGKSNSELRKEWAKNPIEFQKMVNTVKGHEKDLPGFINNMMNTQQQVFIGNMKQTKRYANASDKELKKMYNTYKGFQTNLVTVMQAVKRVFNAIETSIKGSKFLPEFLSKTEKACKVLALAFNVVAASLTKLTYKGKEINGIEIFGERKKAHILSYTRLLNSLRKALGLAGDEGKKKWENLKDTINGVLSIFRTFGFIIKEIINAFKPNKDAAGDFADSILSVTGAIGRILLAFEKWIKTSGIVQTAIFVIKTAINILLAPVKILWNVLTFIISTISKFVNKVGEIGNSVKKTVNPLTKFFNVLKKTFLLIKGSAGSVFSKCIDLLKSFFEPFIKKSNEATSSVPLFQNVISTLTTVIVSLGAKISNAIKNFGKFIEKFVTLEKVQNTGKKFAAFVTDKFIPALKGIFNWIKKIAGGGFLVISDLFNNLWGSAKNVKKLNANNMLPSIDDITNGFSNITNKIKNSSTKILEKIDIRDAILQKLEDLKNIDFGAIFDFIKLGFDNFITFLSEMKDKVEEAFSKIGEAMKFEPPSFEEISDALLNGIDVIISTLASFLPDPSKIGAILGEWISKGILLIARSIPYIVQALSATFRTIASHIPDILVELGNNLKEAVFKGFYEPIKIGSGEFAREIPPLADSISKGFKILGDKLKGSSIDDILGWLNKFLAAGVLNQLRKTLKGNEDLATDIGSFFKKLRGATDDVMPENNKGLINKLLKLSEAIKNFAISLGIVAAIVVILGHIPKDKLQTGGEALTYLGLGIVAFAGALALIQKYTKVDLAPILDGFASLTEGLTKLMLVLMAMSMAKNLAKPLGVLFAVLLELGVFIFAVGKLSTNADKSVKVIDGLSTFMEAISSLMKVLMALAVIPAKAIFTAIVELGLVMAELGILIFALSKIPLTGALKAVANLIPIVAMLAIAIGALVIIKTFDLDPNQLLKIAVAFGILGKVCAILAAVPIMGALQAVGNIAIFLAGLIGILYVLSKLNDKPEVNAFIESGGELLQKIGKSIGKLVGGFAEGVMDSAPAIADKLSQFATHLMPFLVVMKGMPKGVGENIKNLMDAIGAIVKTNIWQNFGEFLSGVLGGGDLESLATRFGKFMTAFIEVINSIPEKKGLFGDSFDKKIKTISKIAKSVKELAEVEKNLEAQGGIADGIFGSKSFEKFISGVKKLYKGFVEVGKTAGDIKNLDNIGKIKDIAKSLAETLAALPDEKKAKYWLDLSGEDKLAKLGKDLIAFGNSVSSFISTYSNVDTSDMAKTTKALNKAINSVAKTVSSKKNTKSFASVGGNAVSTIASGFKDDEGSISKALNKTLSSAIKGVKTDKIEAKGKALAKAFAKALGSYDASDAGKKLAKKAISSMDVSDIKSSATTSGGNVAQGFINGITTAGKLAAAYSAGKKLGNRALDGIKDAIKQGSPSREAFKSGVFLDEGFVLGIKRLTNIVYRSGEKVGSVALDGIKSAISKVNDYTSDSMNAPVIRPVMDLSNVKMGADSIEAMLNRNRYALNVAGSIPEKVSSKNLVINNDITVNGTENPSEWADELMREIETEARTL